MLTGAPAQALGSHPAGLGERPPALGPELVCAVRRPELPSNGAGFSPLYGNRTAIGRRLEANMSIYDRLFDMSGIFDTMSKILYTKVPRGE